MLKEKLWNAFVISQEESILLEKAVWNAVAVKKREMVLMQLQFRREINLKFIYPLRMHLNKFCIKN
jgi:hypothetical protein